MTVVCTALFLATGILALWPTHEPVHVISPVLSALPSEAASSDDGRALAQRAVYIQSEPMAVRGSVAGAESLSRSAAACTAGMVALGLCSAEPEQAQTPAQIESRSDVARLPQQEHARGRCNEAAVALGLCEH